MFLKLENKISPKIKIWRKGWSNRKENLRIYNDEKLLGGGMDRKYESKEVEYKKQLMLIFIWKPRGQ